MNINRSEKEIVYSFPFVFILLEYIFGMYLNNTFYGTPIFEYTTSTDEILAIVLLLWTLKYAFLKRKEPFNKETKIFAAVSLFYLIYSFIIKSNIPVAIFSDLLIQTKPFIGYFMFAYIGFVLNNSQKRILKKVSVYLFILTAIVGLLALLIDIRLLTFLYSHPTYYGSALALIGLTYLFCADIKNKRDIYIFIVILSFSLISGRSKIYGFCAFAIFYVYVLRGNLDLKISTKNIFLFSIAILLVLYVSWEKIAFYFMGANSEDMARYAMYSVTLDIFGDYFPFGSGLGSFGTAFSATYYSPLYSDYGLDNVWGLDPSHTAFVCDAGYPSFAQFGVFGLILLFIFFTGIVKKINNLKKTIGVNVYSQVVILILILLIIQTVAETMLTSHKGFYLMILLSLCMNENRAAMKVHDPEKHII